MKDGEKKIVVLYHAECPDGFGGAWAARKKFKSRALYLPVHHGAPYPKEIKNKEVYLVDFCYKPDMMRKMRKEAKRVVIIDHHKTSIPALSFADEHLFALNHSGSVLAWKYFHPGKSVPKLLLYVEDTDIWKFKLPKSEEILEAIDAYPSLFSVWDILAKKCELKKGRATLIAEGQVLLRKLAKTTDKLITTAEEILFEGRRCLMVNSSDSVSRLGHALAMKKPSIGIVWSRRGNRIVVSLRGDGSVDVSVIAKKYGGGGHHDAAGFSWEEKDFLKFPPKSEK